MVRALLAGTKTQTRRIVKPQPPAWAQHVNAIQHLNMEHRWVPSHLWQWSELQTGKKLRRWPTDPDGDGCDGYAIPCPYGLPGDRLWVREKFSPHNTGTMKFVVFAEGGQKYDDGRYFPPLKEYAAGAFDHIKWKPSIHMPRWASRITLEITGVRVERLQAISEGDAKAEGIEGRKWGPTTTNWRDYSNCHWGTTDQGFISPTASYQTLWESINGPGSWDANPWVWVVEFKRATP